MDDVENLSTAIVENSKVSILSHLIFFLLAKSIRAWNVYANENMAHAYLDMPDEQVINAPKTKSYPHMLWITW